MSVNDHATLHTDAQSHIFLKFVIIYHSQYYTDYII